MGEARRSRPVVMPETPGADVAITEVRAEGSLEYVTITNRGQIAQPLSGWALASLRGLAVFLFPEDTVLEPGAELRVLSGEAAAAGSAGTLVWTRESIWSDRSDTVLLFDSLGREVARRAYPRPTIREERVPKRKILVLDRSGYYLEDWDEEVPPPNIRERGLGPQG
ncbi:MAG: lamin tail domain-containing protein [Anaerolineae bacterium]|nr:lamin tail domain-containing protein [Anaerolineae bacterium]